MKIKDFVSTICNRLSEVPKEIEETDEGTYILKYRLIDGSELVFEVLDDERIHWMQTTNTGRKYSGYIDADLRTVSRTLNNFLNPDSDMSFTVETETEEDDEDDFQMINLDKLTQKCDSLSLKLDTMAAQLNTIQIDEKELMAGLNEMDAKLKNIEDNIEKKLKFQRYLITGLYPLITILILLFGFKLVF